MQPVTADGQGAPRHALARLRQWLPTGRSLPAATWTIRHRAVVVILWAQAAGLSAFAIYQDYSIGHALFEGSIPAGLALLASVPGFDRRLRGTLAAAGLMSCSAILTHISGGYIEAHFHFFVMLGVISLYEDWTPFLVSIAFVGIHHGVVGTFEPASVYNHPDAIAHPWWWALIHATFILGLSVANIFTWRVTEQARAKAAESSARHAAILESALDAIVSVDGRGRIVEFNPSAERIFGYTRDEVLDRDLAALIVPPGDLTEHRDGLLRHLAAGEAGFQGRRLEFPAMRKDGTTFPAELAIVPIRGARGTLFTGYLRDLTHQHEAKQQLEAARLQLARSEKLTAVGQLVSGVAHEVRTPLTYLGTNLHILSRRLERMRAKAPDALQAELIDLRAGMADALEAADRIERLVEDLRRYSRLKSGGQKEDNLQSAVREAVGLFAATHRADVKVHADLLVTPTLRLDRVQVQQVVLNLLQNAAEAMPRGGTITVRTRPREDGALLTVEDEGEGIPMEVRDRIFDPFFTTKTEGTGLGLSIVKRLVEEHKGTIHLMPTPGSGTRFEIFFPSPPDSRAIPLRPLPS